MPEAPKFSFSLGGAQGAKKPGLSLPKKGVAASKKPSAFTSADDDDHDDVLSTPQPFASTSALPGRPKISTATLSKAQKAKQAEEILLDRSVYEYDEVFDKMKEGERKAELEKKKDAGDRKPKYISKLVETAAQRKQDRLRAEDKMVSREREMEGAEFADKDAFVTPAYLAQQEELRRIEEEEKKQEEANAGKRGGMSTFYKSYLDSSSKVHEAAVAASLSKDPTPSSSTSFTIEPPPPDDVPREKTEAELAAEVSAATGKRIELNADGFIIDKRELMTGGLNIVKKASPNAPGGLGFSAPIKEREAAKEAAASAASSAFNGAGGLSAAERGKQSRERHSRLVEQQMMELETRRKREAEEALEQKVQKVAKRNDETKVEELKRKAEERRKKREEDQKKAAVAS